MQSVDSLLLISLYWGEMGEGESPIRRKMFVLIKYFNDIFVTIGPAHA